MNTPTNQGAFFGDAKLKNFYENRVLGHQKADEIVQGKYWENGKGCALGCTVHSDKHLDMAKKLNIPLPIVYLEERIFERLDNTKAKEFPLAFIQAIRTGADLSLVTAKMMLFILLEVLQYVGEDEKSETATKSVIGLYERLIAGDSPAQSEWSAAAADANYAVVRAADANYAAYTAAYASVYASAYADARAADVADVAAAAAAVRAAAAAVRAAEAAARATARAAAHTTYKEFYTELKDKFLEILAEAPLAA